MPYYTSSYVPHTSSASLLADVTSMGNLEQLLQSILSRKNDYIKQSDDRNWQYQDPLLVVTIY